MSVESGLLICGRVILTLRDERDRIIDRQEHKNTITNWTRAVIASFLTGSSINIGSGSTLAPSLPAYIALGTGTGTPAVTDQAMFAESYQTRKQNSYRDVLQGYYAQTVVNYGVNDPNGTFTELGLWDQGTTNITLSAQAAAGASTLSLGAGAPQMYKGQQVYLSNGTNSETVTLSQSYAAGASSWATTSPLQYTYASGSTQVAYSGNLCAHVALAGSGITKGTGSTLAAQWQIFCQAG